MAVSGISGGTIDVAGIVSQLMEVERAPLAKIQKDLSGIQTKLSAWGKIQSAVSSLRDATTAMTRFDAWRGAKASSNDETILAATGGTGAAAGNYSFTVEKLAQSQSVVSAGFAASDTVVGGGTLHIQLGAVDQGGNVFTADPARPAIDVVIPADATLADIRSAINNADAGVSATILGDGANKRLVLTSTESGRQHAFEITATDADGDDTDASGISAFASSATAASGANGTQRTQAARDAELTVNGLAITAGSNRVTDVIEGVTLTLKKTTATPIEVAIGNDQEASRALVDQFVTAYNALNSVITEQTDR
ncbi:MAG: flagellar filament capping protein FliD, partial [Lautropia sp.]